MYLSDVFTVPVNLAGLPAVSIPVGVDQEAMPIGLQLIGPYLEESRILAAAHDFQQETTWHQRVPEGFS